MSPGAGNGVSPSANGTAVAIIDEEGLGAEENYCRQGPDPNCELEGKNLKKGAVWELSYEDATEVSSEFVIKDPEDSRLATRGCDSGDDDCELPVVDMSPLMTLGAEDQQRAHQEDAAKNVTAAIGRAAETWGFFQALNHGIPQDLLDRLIEVAQEFFRLPLEEKQVYSVEPGGIEGYGNMGFGQVRSWTDTLRHTMRPRPAPEKDRLPDKPTAYRALIEEYTQGVENILRVVWRSLSQFLGLEPTTLRKAQEKDWRLVVGLNYYPKCPEPEKVWGAEAHKDFGSITVLLQDEVGGLQFQKPGANNENVWVDVKPKRGSLLINIANQVEILSNGRFNSGMHRVVVNRSKARLSIAAFATPSPKCIICPLAELLEKTQQAPLYKQLVYEDYVPNMRLDIKAGLQAHTRYEINRK